MGSFGVSSIEDKIRENILRWFGHVVMWEATKTVRVVMKINVEGKIGRWQKKDGSIRLRVLWGLLVCAKGMWKIETSGSLEQRGLIPNSSQKGEGEEETPNRIVLFFIQLKQ